MTEDEKPLPKGWLQMGAELEGSWTSHKRAEIAEKVRGAKAVRDDSVHIGYGDCGEIITRPHADIEALCADIVKLYPDTVHESCGFHIHTSFTPLNGSVIASRQFYDYFKEQWRIWGKKEKLANNHEFWSRLNGVNKNTRDEFVPETQLKGDGRGKGGKGGQARYTILNFYSWEIHQTVECRLLPMFEGAERAIKAVHHLAWIYDSFLALKGFQNITFEPVSQIQGERVVETYESTTPSLEPKRYEAKGEFPHLVTGADIYYHIPGATDEMLPYKIDTGKQSP